MARGKKVKNGKNRMSSKERSNLLLNYLVREKTKPSALKLKGKGCVFQQALREIWREEAANPKKWALCHRWCRPDSFNLEARLVTKLKESMRRTKCGQGQSAPSTGRPLPEKLKSKTMPSTLKKELQQLTPAVVLSGSRRQVRTTAVIRDSTEGFGAVSSTVGFQRLRIILHDVAKQSEVPETSTLPHCDARGETSAFVTHTTGLDTLNKTQGHPKRPNRALPVLEGVAESITGAPQTCQAPDAAMEGQNVHMSTPDIPALQNRAVQHDSRTEPFQHEDLVSLQQILEIPSNNNPERARDEMNTDALFLLYKKKDGSISKMFRRLRPGCECPAENKCGALSAETRKELFLDFWGPKATLSTRIATVKKLVDVRSAGQHGHFYSYHLAVSGEKLSVCQTQFLHTLGLLQSDITDWLQQVSPTQTDTGKPSLVPPPKSICTKRKPQPPTVNTAGSKTTTRNLRSCSSKQPASEQNGLQTPLTIQQSKNMLSKSGKAIGKDRSIHGINMAEQLKCDPPPPKHPHDRKAERLPSCCTPLQTRQKGSGRADLHRLSSICSVCHKC